jgi:cytochrome c biogenesis factor
VLAKLKISGETGGTVNSGMRFFDADGSNMTAAGIKTNYKLGEDVYTTVAFSNLPGTTLAADGPAAIDLNGGVLLTVRIKPLVNLVWLAGLLFIAGSLVAHWPDAREQRRLVARMAPARA